MSNFQTLAQTACAPNPGYAGKQNPIESKMTVWQCRFHRNFAETRHICQIYKIGKESPFGKAVFRSF
jgi:hypothetical protein